MCSSDLIDKDGMDRLRDKCVLVDVSIDEGGATAATHGGRYTTHSNPIRIYKNSKGNRIKVFAVQNIPSLRSVTASLQLEAASVPYFKILGQQGLDVGRVVAASPALARGIITYNGFLTNRTVCDRYAKDLGVKDIPYKPLAELLRA